jgi:hypothetical protein
MSDTIASPGYSTDPAIDHRNDASVTPRVVTARRAFTALAWLFAICVAAQVFLAGMAVFNGPAWWSDHVTFIHLFEYVPLLMLLAAFLGKMPARIKWLSLLAFGLVALQYAFVALGSSSLPALAALHPVNALVIFWLAIRLAKGATTPA